MIYTLDPKQYVFADLGEDHAVLLNLSSKHYFRMNATSYSIWKGLEQSMTWSQLLSHLTEQFDVNVDQAEHDLRDFITHLAKEGFINLEKALPPDFDLTQAKASKAKSV